MHASKTCLFALAMAVTASAPGWAQQQAGVPPDIAAKLRAIGPVINVPAVAELYTLAQASAPHDGVKKTADVHYGPDARNRLDVYAPPTKASQPTPVLVFIHGGGFVRGDKSQPGSPFYDNIGYYFARHGVLTILATYRLAPQHPWPTGAEDVAGAVRWTHANAAKFGGDPKRVVLWGHSAGAAHAAAYGLDKRFQPKGGPGLAGLILMAGVYDPVLETEGAEQLHSSAESNQAYYGKDPAKYAARAPIRHMTGPKLPVMLIISELDPPMMHIETGALFAALCQRDKRCPALVTPRDHDHISEAYAINTPDETVSGPALAFIEAPK
jgi:acetyl esterase/lipase